MCTAVSAVSTAFEAALTALFLLLWLTVWPAWRLIPHRRVRSA
jgi:hypothetical protein